MHRPSPDLRDGTLVVRQGQASDAPAILAFFQANRTAFGPVEPRRPDNFYTLESCHMRLAMHRNQLEEGRSACLFVFDADNRTVIGTVNFTNISGYPHYGATLGYSLAQSEWGKGRMVQALRLALDWLFDAFNLHRVAANHLPDNERSARVLAKLGFKQEGYAPDYLLIDGIWRDHVLTALTHTDWQARDLHAPLIVGGTGTPQK